MKKLIGFLVLFVCAFSHAQTPTPNIGLQIPATGSNNWYIPLNYNFSKLDQLLSGNLPLPALSVTNDVHIGGNLYANQFIGPSGSSFATATAAAQYSPVYYCGTGTSSAFCGVAPFSGISAFQTNGGPRAATISDVLALWVGGGCTGTNYLRADGTCQSALPAGVTSINGTPGAFTFTGAGVTCTTTTCTFNGGGGSVGTQGQLQAAGATAGTFAAATPNNVNAALGSSNGLDIFGDSIGGATGATSTGPGNVPFQNGYSYLVQQTIGGPFLLGGVAGDMEADVNYKWIYRAANPQGAGIDPVYAHELGTNDAINYLGDANKQKIFQRLDLGSLAWLAVPRSNKTFAQNCTLAGGMANDANTIFAGLGAVATTNGATASCAITAPKANDTIYACYLIQDANTGTFTLSLDGVAQTDPFNGTTTWNAFGDGGAAIQTQNGVKSGVACARFTGVSAGSHTVLFTVTSATGSTAAVWPQWVGAAPASSTQNPYVIAVSPNQQNTGSAGAPFVATYQGFISGIVSNLAADGLNVSYSNTSNALLNSPSCGNGNQAAMFANCYADNIHPNNTGHSVMASTIESSTPASALLAVTHWNPKQPGQNYLPAQPLSPYQFFDVNPYNLTGNGNNGWVPGIKFNGSNGQVFYEAYNINTGLTVAGPAGTGIFAVCPYGGSGYFAAAPPALTDCYMTVVGNGLVNFFNSSVRIQNNLMQMSSGSTFYMPGIIKSLSQATGSTASGAWATQTGTVGQNYNSGMWCFNAGVYDAVLGLGGYNGPCWQGVPITPTPGGSKGQTYLTFQPGSAQGGIDLRNANLTNHLGNSDAGSFNATSISLNGTPIPANPIILTTTSLGGSALAAGACSSTTITQSGVGGTTQVLMTPSSGGPGNGFYWQAWGSASNTITAQVCAVVAGTPLAQTYTLKVYE